MALVRNRLRSPSLLWQVLVPILACVAVGLAAVQTWTFRHTTALLEARLTASLDANLALLRGELGRNGTDWHRDGARLLVGKTVMNGRNDVVDTIAQIAGGVATIFAGDTRIASTIRKDDGSRAVGTTLAPGPARSTALDQGRTYRGLAMILGKEYLTIYQPVRDSSGSVAGILFVGLPTAGMRAALADSLWQTIFISITMLIFLGLIVALMLRRVLKPLGLVTRAMNDLAKGDTTVTVPPLRRDDEAGRLIAALGVFKKQAEENRDLAREREDQRAQADAAKREALVDMAEAIERAAGDAMVEVAKRTQAMEQGAETMAESAGLTSHSAESAASSATLALINSETVASAAEELTASVHEIGAQVGQSTQIVARAVEAGRATRDTIDQLTSQVDQIGHIAEIIREIAARTNLLALNATIEAARAGEAGKGFAVVASEVKQLANQTARSTDEIARHLAGVRNATGASVAAVERIEATISEINAIAGSIAAAVEEQSAATGEIARNVGETATAARDVTERTREVSAEAVKTGEQAGRIRLHATGLNAAIEGLRHALVHVVRTSTKDVERRKDRRRSCQVEATITGNGKTEAATVTDVSESGCGLASSLSINPGDRVEIVLGRFGNRQHATVVAQGSGRLHVRFVGDGLSAKEVDRISRETIEDVLKAAKDDHLDFARRVQEAVFGSGTVPDNEPPDHHNCRFGRWYHGVSDPLMVGLPSFSAIAEPHRQVHACGSRALMALQGGDKASAQRAFEELHRHSEDVIRSLDMFEREYLAARPVSSPQSREAA